MIFKLKISAFANFSKYGFSNFAALFPATPNGA